MKFLSTPLNPVARFIAASVVCGSMITLGSQAYAATAAGTEIKNLATVTYTDAAGNSYSAQSNEAVVTVAQVYSASIGLDVDTSGAPGQTVYLPYVLTNLGNGTDTYEVAAADGITGPDVIDATAITVTRDTNGNGQPDPGEPELTTLSLTADEKADILVAVQIPTTAVAGNTLGITLTAGARNGTAVVVAGGVTDADPGGGRDTNNVTGTVESLITVTNNAVLAMTTTSSHNIAANEITYTVTVSNNGNTTAKDVVIFNGFPADTTYRSHSFSGLLASNGDTIPTVPSNLVEDQPDPAPDWNFNVETTLDQIDDTEATIGIDLNTNGDTADGTVQGIYVVDSELAPNATVSMTFTVSYNPDTYGGGNVIENVAYLTAITSGPSGVTDVLETSNRTSDEVVQSHSLTVSDTGVAGGDAGDSDGLVNGTQLVASAPSGGVVLFDVNVTNTGNGIDSFELFVTGSSFPTGTIFTFIDNVSSVQLTDTNGVGGVDTGELAKDESRTVRVRAKLPQGVFGSAGYTAQVDATSAVDSAAIPAKASTNITLTAIVEASADVHASNTGTDAANEDPFTGTYVPVATIEADAGATVNVPVYIDNESNISDSFQLFAGSTYNGTALGALPTGWDVQFFLADSSIPPLPTGPAITSTSTLPGGTLNHGLIAVVTLPADTTLSEANVSYDANGDTVLTETSHNDDSDGDYPLFIQIISANSKAKDIVMLAIDVNAGRAVAFTPSSSNQVEPGGTVDYPITLSNTGNSEETLELSSANSQPGFNHTISIDTDGDAIPDTLLGNLAAGNITVELADGTDQVITVVRASAADNPALVIPPGIDIPLLVSVFAPATAPAGQVDVLTLDATNVSSVAGGPSTSVSFQSDVINGQVRLTKTAAVDVGCDGLALSAFQAVQNIEVEPEDCIVWRVVAENQGDVDATNVVITDSAPAFSTLEASSLAYCLTNDCTPTTVDVPATVVGSAIIFYIGEDPVVGTTGGKLVPGQKATAQFSVKVE